MPFKRDQQVKLTHMRHLQGEVWDLYFHSLSLFFMECIFMEFLVDHEMYYTLREQMPNQVSFWNESMFLKKNLTTKAVKS